MSQVFMAHATTFVGTCHNCLWNLLQLFMAHMPQLFVAHATIIMPCAQGRILTMTGPLGYFYYFQ